MGVVLLYVSVALVYMYSTRGRIDIIHIIIYNKRKTPCLDSSWTHQILGIEGNLVPPRRHKLVVAVEDAAVHVLIPPGVKEGLEPTESGEQEAGQFRLFKMIRK